MTAICPKCTARVRDTQAIVRARFTSGGLIQLVPGCHKCGCELSECDEEGA